MMNMFHDLLNFLIQSPTALYLTVGILGLCIGSFLNCGDLPHTQDNGKRMATGLAC